MSYTKREWATGNVVGAVDLNRMKQGIEDAGSGQVLVVTDTDGTLDKTWQEIYDAFPNVYIVYDDSYKVTIHTIGPNGSSFYIGTYTDTYSVSSSADYPIKSNTK